MEEGMTAIAEEQAAPAIETQQPIEAPKDEPIDLDAPVEAEAEAGSEHEGEAGTGEGENAATGDLDYVEIELNGKAYQVPKELEGGFMKNTDYTQKTQALSARQKELDAREEQVNQRSQFTEDELGERATLMSISAQLQHYRTVDWDAADDSDPVNAQKHWRNFQLLEKQEAQLLHNLGERQAIRTREAQQDFAKRIEETKAFAQQKIPGWTPQIDEKVHDFVLGEGISKEMLVQAMNPQVYKIMHLAWLGSQSLQKQQQAPAKPAPTISPLRTVTAKANTNVTKDPADMSMAEYVAWSNRKSKK